MSILGYKGYFCIMEAMDRDNLPVTRPVDHDIQDRPNRFLHKTYVRMEDDIKVKYIERLTKTGLLAQTALDVGVSIETARIHRNNDEEFGAAVDFALDVYRDSISSEVHRRGIEGVRTPVFYMGRQCGTIRKYSDKMLEMHAKRHIPEYRDKVEIDAHFSGGVLVIPAGTQSVEEWEKQDNASLDVIDVHEVEEIPSGDDRKIVR